MDRQQSIFVYILAFIIISILLKAFGVIEFGNAEILAYALTFYGISVSFISFGRERRASLFLGTVVFLTGILLFLLTNYTFLDNSLIIFPSVFLILGIGFLMLYLDETAHRVPLYVAVVFIITGLVFTFLWGSPAFFTFIGAAVSIFLKAIPLIIIIALLLVLLIRRR